MTSEGPDEPASEHSEDLVNAGITRRGVVRAAGAGALALGLSGATATAAQASTAAAAGRPANPRQGPAGTGTTPAPSRTTWPR